MSVAFDFKYKDINDRTMTAAMMNKRIPMQHIPSIGLYFIIRLNCDVRLHKKKEISIHQLLLHVHTLYLPLSTYHRKYI